MGLNKTLFALSVLYTVKKKSTMNASENKIIDAINFAWTKQKAINYNIKKMFNSFKINKGIFWGERLKNGSYKIW